MALPISLPHPADSANFPAGTNTLDRHDPAQPAGYGRKCPEMSIILRPPVGDAKRGLLTPKSVAGVHFEASPARPR